MLERDDLHDMGQNLRLGLYMVELRPRGNQSISSGNGNVQQVADKPAKLVESKKVKPGRKAKDIVPSDKLRDKEETLTKAPPVQAERHKGKLVKEAAVVQEEHSEPTPVTVTQLKAFRAVHNARVGHVGAKLTWSRLNKSYPGHTLSMRQISDLISECGTCVKTRASLMHSIKPIVRTIKPPHQRSAIGIDAVEITPNGADGHTHIIVIINLFTKHSFLVRSKGCTAVNLANAVWLYWYNFGVTDMIVSDKGPDLTSVLFKLLRNWMGMRHQFSITDKHANGVERTIKKEVQRHLRAIVYDERMSDIFTDKSIIPAIQFLLNDEVSSQTAMRPFEFTFGTQDAAYLKLPKAEVGIQANEYLARLNYNLSLLREISSDYQKGLIKERTDITPAVEQNKYQKGDFVLFDKGPKPHPKLAPRYAGPYQVIKQVKNDVEVRRVIMGNVATFSVEDLIVFSGDVKSAKDAALRDHSQYEVNTIIRHRGNPLFRSSMEFYTKFADEDERWMRYSKDLFDSIPYAEYVSKIPYLKHLAYSSADAEKYIRDINSNDITTVVPGDTVYVDIAWFGITWGFDTVGLPDIFPRIYVFEFRYTHYFHDLTQGRNLLPTVSRKIISASCKVMNATYKMTTHQVFAYGSNKVLDASVMELITPYHAKKYPQLLAD
jgi:hypothetical protein